MALQFALNRLFVVTANMGTLFENEKVEKNWLLEFEKVISQADPDLVALHCQEIGGKDFEIQMPKVTEFVSKLRRLKCFKQFDRVRGWLDTNFKDPNGFTALGNIYIFHERVEPICLWDFQAETFIEVTGEVLEFDTLSPGHCHRKTRFPNDFYPDVKWSRKGFLHTRWRLFGSHVINFVNIHMFHDEDNIVALEKSPSVYTSYRRKALEYTFTSLSETLGHNRAESEPLFLYGDFNFRLDFSAVVKHILTTNHQTQIVKAENGCVDRIEYRTEGSSDDTAVVTVERKRFVPLDVDQFTQHFLELLQYDHEGEHFQSLRELPITFQPSYPFTEDVDVEDGNCYMDKRCPAWCDRITMNESGLNAVKKSPLGFMYNMIGKQMCVGDHKPVYLFFTVASTSPMRQLPESCSKDT